MNIFKKILLPTDFSEWSKEAIEYTISLAVSYDAQIHILHVVDNVPVLAFHSIDLNSETVLRDSERQAKEALDGLIKSHFTYNRNLVPVIRHGEASKEIVKYACEEGMDLIIMATHGRTGLAHVVMGSIAEKVVRHSEVPVLTIKPLSLRPTWVKQQDIDEQLHIQQ